MIYKRATQVLRDAGIEHIVIEKLRGGATPQDVRAAKQTSRCFGSWQDAVGAVVSGFRPKVWRWRGLPELWAERDGGCFRITLEGTPDTGRYTHYNVCEPDEAGWEELLRTVQDGVKLAAILPYEKALRICEFISGGLYPDPAQLEVSDEREQSE